MVAVVTVYFNSSSSKAIDAFWPLGVLVVYKVMFESTMIALKLVI
jgi:hypothetical protein